MKRYTIYNNDQPIDYEILHRPRVTRRIHLETNNAGDLRVVAPRRMSRQAINKTLQQRAGHVARFLIKAPAECIDYVIAHEVCHLREHNHGKEFYVLQEQLYPGWRDAKALLTDRGHVFLHRPAGRNP